MDGRPCHEWRRVRRPRDRAPAPHDRRAPRVLQAAGLVLSDIAGEWECLEPAWRECLSLTWEAYAAGTIPVGAVVIGPDGQVVARGRNRVYDRDAPPGELAYTLLAHAEVNALAQLPPEPRYEDHVLLTALEPCVLCIGATRLATVSAIRYGAPDPYGGAARFTMTGANPMLDRLGLEVSGPELGALGVFVTALHAELFLRRRADGFVVAAYRERQPEVLRIAKALRERGITSAPSEGAELTDILSHVSHLVAPPT